MSLQVEETPRLARADPQRRFRGHDSPPRATKQPWAGKRPKYHDALQKPAWTGRAGGAASVAANLGLSGWGNPLQENHGGFGDFVDTPALEMNSMS
jgi:hypothetical protein